MQDYSNSPGYDQSSDIDAINADKQRMKYEVCIQTAEQYNRNNNNNNDHKSNERKSNLQLIDDEDVNPKNLRPKKTVKNVKVDSNGDGNGVDIEQFENSGNDAYVYKSLGIDPKKYDDMPIKKIGDKMYHACEENERTPKEEFEHFIRKRSQKLAELGDNRWMSINIRTTPYPDAFYDLMQRVKVEQPSMLAETSIIGLGYAKMYADIKANNIVGLLTLVRNIKSYYNVNSQAMPRLSMLNVSTDKRNGGVTIHSDLYQHGMLAKNSDMFNIGITDLTQLCCIYMFNLCYGKTGDFKEEYEMYYSDEGFIEKIRDNFKTFRSDLLIYLVEAYSNMQEQLEIEMFRKNKSYGGKNIDSRINGKKKIFAKATEYLKDPKTKEKLDELGVKLDDGCQKTVLEGFKDYDKNGDSNNDNINDEDPLDPEQHFVNK